MTGLHGKKKVFVCVLLAGLFVLISVCSIVYACTVTSVSLSVSDESEEDAENNPDVDSMVIPIGNTAYFCAVCELENPNNEDVDWQFDLDGNESYETEGHTDYDSEGEYLTYPPEGTSFFKEYSNAGEFTIRAQARLDDGKDTWWEGPATCTVTVVKVDHVIEIPTVAAVGEDIVFIAYSFPSGQPLDAIEWQKRSKAESGDPWGGWTNVSGSSDTAVLNTTEAGYYQYQARNGEHDEWQPSAQVVVVEITDIYVVNSAGVNNTVLGHVSCTIEPSDRTVSWSIGEPDLDCDIEEDDVNTTAKITPATTGGTITVIATASGVSGTYNKEIPLDVVKISNMTFSPAAIATAASGTDETVASVTVVPSGRTMSWEILADDLGCDIFSATSTTADIDAGIEAGTVTVRAKDSEIEGCYLDDTLDVVGVELTGQPDPGELCLVYTGSYPELHRNSHPEEGEPLHGTEPTISFTVEGTPSGGTYLWVPVDESGYGKLEIDDGETSSTVTFRGARESTLIEDALFSVYYTVNGCTSEGQYGYTVSRPKFVTYLEGEYSKPPAWVGQSFYFLIEDQFNNDINVEGITCWEKLTAIVGIRGKEKYTTTKVYDNDDKYKGEIAFQDRLQIGRSHDPVENSQILYVGGWDVKPTYTLYLWYYTEPENGVRRE